MVRTFIHQLLLFFLLIASTLASAEPVKTAPHTVLFIGNSLTYFNGGIDHHLAQLARGAREAHNPLTYRSAYGGETLHGHLHRRNSSALINLLRWDTLVLQEYSNGPLTDYSRFVKAAGQLARQAEAQTTRAVLFMPWGYAQRPAMTEALAKAYYRAGEALELPVVPVGEAFALARQQRPAINLYSDDRHPSKAGTYLAACVFYAFLFDQPATSSAYFANLGADKARFLQGIADTVVNAMPQPADAD